MTTLCILRWYSSLLHASTSLQIIYSYQGSAIEIVLGVACCFHWYQRYVDTCWETTGRNNTRWQQARFWPSSLWIPKSAMPNMLFVVLFPFVLKHLARYGLVKRKYKTLASHFKGAFRNCKPTTTRPLIALSFVTLAIPNSWTKSLSLSSVRYVGVIVWRKQGIHRFSFFRLLLLLTILIFWSLKTVKLFQSCILLMLLSVLNSCWSTLAVLVLIPILKVFLISVRTLPRLWSVVMAILPIPITSTLHKVHPLVFRMYCNCWLKTPTVVSWCKYFYVISIHCHLTHLILVLFLSILFTQPRWPWLMLLLYHTILRKNKTGD